MKSVYTQHSLGRSYTPSIEDVGAYLALYWLPSRADGKVGKQLVSICDAPVSPGKNTYFL